jgi:hypothetical protein
MARSVAGWFQFLINSDGTPTREALNGKTEDLFTATAAPAPAVTVYLTR